MVTGQCQCGAVRFSAGSEISELSHCHCSMCRRLHGAAFVSFAGISRREFAWSGNADLLKKFASSAGTDRLFCAQCGSQLACVLSSDPDHLYLAMGVLDGNPSMPAAFHQYVDSGVAWISVDDGLPQFAAENPGGQ